MKKEKIESTLKEELETLSEEGTDTIEKMTTLPGDNLEFEDGTVEDKVEKLPPYAIRYNEIKALFGDDPELDISVLDDSTHSFEISSANYHKIYALSEILKDDEFVFIRFKYLGESNAYAEMIKDAFAGNPHFDNVRIATEAGTGAKHVITTFKDETIQYAADNRFVPGGYETTLAEKIVKDVFKKEYRRSVYITKDKKLATVSVARAATTWFDVATKV